MKTININATGVFDFSIQFPDSWNDLLPTEILEIAKQILNPTENVAESKAALLLAFINARAKEQKIKLPKKWEKEINVEGFVINGFPLLDFIWAENNLSNPPENKITLKGTRSFEVFAPIKGFGSITCGEFEEAEPAFIAFTASQNVEDLAKLAAIFWRPKGVKFQTKKTDGTIETYPYEKWAKLFEKVEPHRLYAIYIWYVGSKNLLPSLFPTVHEPSEEETVDNSNPAMAFTRCIHAGAGAKNGDRNTIRITLLYEFMFDMEENAKNAKLLKAQANESSN